MANQPTDTELGQQAYEKLLRFEEMFTGLADEIYPDGEGYVVFRFGGEECKLWHYTILNYPLIDVQTAVIMAKPSHKDK